MRTTGHQRQRPGIGQVLLLVLGGVLSLPILLPVAIVGHVRSQRRLRKLVDTFRCLSCGGCLGQEAIRLADERCAAEAREREAQFPGVKWRLVRTLHAVCPHCGWEYTYREADHTLVRKAGA